MRSTRSGERMLGVVGRGENGYSRRSSPMKDTSSGSDGRDVGSGEKSSRGRGERHANEDVLIRGGKYVDRGSR